MNDTDDWYDVTRVTDHSHQISEVGRYNVFLVDGADRSLVVDAGIGVGDLRGVVESLADPPFTLLLTHSHWDHIGSMAAFDDVRLHDRELPADGTVTIDSLTDEFVGRPAQFVEGWRAEGNAFPDGFDPESYTIAPATDVRPIEDGDEIDLGGRVLEVVDTPGHSPGHVVALDRDAGVLYGGDVIHRDRGLYVQFRDCDLPSYVETFDRLADLRDEGAFDTMVTGHNQPIGGDDLSLIDDLRDGVEGILAGDLDYEVEESNWGRVRRYDVAGSPVYTKTTID